MASCETERAAPLRCPTPVEVLDQALALLPRGRAWQSHEGGPRVGGVLRGFWTAVADVIQFATQRLCALRFEFWCATRSETDDLWMREYGLPDLCDPFPDLCAKVAAIGGATCEYYVASAARIGYAIDCAADLDQCGAIMGCDFMGDCMVGGISATSRMIITVDLATSPAYVGRFDALPYMGCMQMGDSLACDPDISPLVCLLDRIVQAHIEIVYRIILPPTYLMVGADTHLATETGALMITG